jgi:D-alanyl-D-alanine carboxypeptidase
VTVDAWENLPRPIRGGLTYFDQFGDGKLTNITNVQTRLVAASIGDDGILASDDARFVETIFKGNLVSPASMKAMTTWLKMEEPISDEWYYGLG